MSENSNTKQAFWIALGSLASFGFSIVSSMFLSRCIAKADYGTYRQVMYVYTTLLTVFTLGLPKAYSYFLPRVATEQAAAVVTKITRIFYIMGAVFSTLLFVLSPAIAGFLNNPDLTDALRIFAPVPLLLLPTMGLESIYATCRRTHVVTFYTIATRLFMLLCVVLPVVLLHGGYQMALWGFVASSALNFLLALYLKNKPYRSVPAASRHPCPFSYRDIFAYSLPLLYASLWGAVIHSADQFFISRYFGRSVFAEFSNGFMDLPFIGMIVGACSTVLFPLFSRMDHEQLDPRTQIYPVWRSVFAKTALLIYPLLVFCFVYADEIMQVLYGGQYAGSGIYFRIKTVENIFAIISYAPLLLAIGKTRLYANVHAYGAIALVVLEYLCALCIDSPEAIAVVSVACRTGRIAVLLLYIARFFRTSLLHLFPIRLIALIIIPGALFLEGWKHLVSIDNVLAATLAAGSAYAVFFLLWSAVAKLDYLSIIKPLIKR